MQNCVKNDCLMKECAIESYKDATDLMVMQQKMTPEYKAILEKQVEDIVMKRCLARTTKELNVETNQKFWLIVTGKNDFRDIDVSILVSFVST